MKKKIIAIALSTTLLVGCGSAKNIDPCCAKDSKKEVVSGENDPIMKLLLSGLILLSLNILVTR
jgi:uncharacterized protein YcfL